jgi:hypothetical protein
MHRWLSHVNKLYWITHCPISMLLGLCTCRMVLLFFGEVSSGVGLFSIGISMMVIIIYIDRIAPIVEQHDPRLFKQSLWE